MVGRCGKWLAREEFLTVSGLSLAELENQIGAGGVLVKRLGEREYIWMDSPDCFMKAGEGGVAGEREREVRDQGTEERGELRPANPPAAEQAEAAAQSSEPLPRAGVLEKAGRSSAGEVSEEAAETILTRFTGLPEMALQVERAISLVERSLSAFMRMHEEVLVEKDRAVERAREGLSEKEVLIKSKEEEVQKLSRLLKEKDQEIADLKMLAEILEERAAKAGGRENQREIPQRASVGDLMEEQLRYIMEDQMIKELLK